MSAAQTTADAGRAAEKIAPVQGYSAGIPWSMHLRAYDAYCKKHGPQKALIDLEGRGCRGGFGVGELDMFIPGWRDELSELHRLRRRVVDLESENAAAPDLVKALESCQRVLADLISGDKSLSTINIYARAVEAELKARAALSSSRSDQE